MTGHPAEVFERLLLVEGVAECRNQPRARVLRAAGAMWVSEQIAAPSVPADELSVTHNSSHPLCIANYMRNVSPGGSISGAG